MRWVPRGSFRRITALPWLWQAWKTYARGKRRWPAVARFAIDADRHVLALQRRLLAGDYRPGRYHQRVIRDPKLRLISAPPVRERVLHHAIVDDIGPSYTRSYIRDSYACLAGRGPQRAALRYLGWTRRYRWRLCLDIKRYFLSVDHRILLDLIAARLRDENTLDLVRMLVDHGGGVYRTELAARTLGLEREPVPASVGLAIGSQMSQWAANLYLDGLDQYVKRTLGVRAYLRYMDDMALFADDRAVLEEARAAIGEWLARERRLRLNRKRWQVLSTRQASTYLGYRVSRSGLTPGRKIRRRMPDKLRAAARRGPAAVGESVRSYAALIGFG